jgi:hypothetical protein
MWGWTAAGAGRRMTVSTVMSSSSVECKQKFRRQDDSGRSNLPIPELAGRSFVDPTGGTIRRLERALQFRGYAVLYRV